jgi:hypothetical protein
LPCKKVSFNDYGIERFIFHIFHTTLTGAKWREQNSTICSHYAVTVCLQIKLAEN